VRMDLKQRRKRLRYKLKYLTNRPRLSIHKTNNYIYAQLIDQKTGNVLASYDTKRLVKQFPDAEQLNGMEKALKMGEILGKQILDKKIKEIVFDRSGYKYHGKIKAVAEGLRKAGLKF